MNSYELPLFPLNVVVCPDGLLPLRIFEARYLDMVKNCLRSNSQFGVVTILPEGETDLESNFPFSNIGTSVEIVDADVSTVGLINIRCTGHHRIMVNSFTQREDGLVIGEVTDVENDIKTPIPEGLEFTSISLERLIESFQGIPLADIPIIKPYKFNDSSWVANRWVELLNLPIVHKYRLMKQESPIVRLELIQDLLNIKTSKNNK